jgi:hypothetical protein
MWSIYKLEKCRSRRSVAEARIIMPNHGKRSAHRRLVATDRGEGERITTKARMRKTKKSEKESRDHTPEKRPVRRG